MSAVGSVAGSKPPGAAVARHVKLTVKDRVWTGREFLAEVQKDPKQMAELAKDGIRLEADPRVMAELRASDLGHLIGPDGSIEPPEASASVGVAIGVAVLVLAAAGIGFAWGYAEGYND